MELGVATIALMEQTSEGSEHKYNERFECCPVARYDWNALTINQKLQLANSSNVNDHKTLPMTFQDIAELFRSFMYDAFNKTEQDPNPV
jgi:hypothetical protein